MRAAITSLARGRAAAFRPAAAVTAAVLAAAGCSTLPASAPAPPPAAAALSYMDSHREPPVPGMTTAVILTMTETEFTGDAARQTGCPARLSADVRGAVGELPMCLTWRGTAETADGRTISYACGSIIPRKVCPLALDPDGDIPGPGDYVRLRAGGRIRKASDLTTIEISAVYVPAPDPGLPSQISKPAPRAQ